MFTQGKIASLTLIILFCCFFCTNQQQKSPQEVISQQQKQQIPYTEDIQQFKAKKYNQRLQMVVGCWLLSKQYLSIHKSDHLFFKDEKIKELATLKLVKQCMKKIDRKEAVLKITQLVGKNISPAKKYQDLVNNQVIDSIFVDIGKLAIANYHHYEPVNIEALNFSMIEENRTHNGVGQGNKLSGESQKTQESSTIDNQENFSFSLSQFDNFLLDLIQKYNSEFHKLISSKQGLKAKVEEELKKRQKYYFGFIPASSFTHSVFLVTISLSMVFCCTCYKYYKMRSAQTEERKKRISEGHEDPHSHSHSKHKQAKKVTRMTQLTMRKKIR